MNRQKILDLYAAGNSAKEIHEQLGSPQSVRTIQRVIRAQGIQRSRKDSFRIALRKGRVPKTRPKVSVQPIEEIVRLYVSGLSACEIKQELALSVSVRQIQRIVSGRGVQRSVGDAFRLAVSRGRVTYHYKPEKRMRKRLESHIRQDVLFRDKYRCVQCGVTGKEDRLQVDHLDGDKNNNVLSNLQTLCEACNKTKYWRVDKNAVGKGVGEYP